MAVGQRKNRRKYVSNKTDRMYPRYGIHDPVGHKSVQECLGGYRWSNWDNHERLDRQFCGTLYDDKQIAKDLLQEVREVCPSAVLVRVASVTHTWAIEVMA